MDQKAIGQALDHITAGLAQVMLGIRAFKGLALTPEPSAELDPAAPDENKIPGTLFLSPKGVERCYEMYDGGASKFAVAKALRISESGAKRRKTMWTEAGGVNRPKQPLEEAPRGKPRKEGTKEGRKLPSATV